MRLRTAAFAGIVVALIVAACGGGGTDSADRNQAPERSVTATPSGDLTPEQIQSVISADSDSFGKISLIALQQGQQVTRGDLLQVPLDSENLFVQPYYLRSSPEAVHVVVVHARGRDVSLAAEPTLRDALNVIVGRADPSVVKSESLFNVYQGTPIDSVFPPQKPTTVPTSTPSDKVGVLIEQADGAFRVSQEHRAEPDPAGYAEEIARLEEILTRLAQITDFGD